jgi:hypothetical protein
MGPQTRRRGMRWCLPTAYCLLPTAYRLLPTTYYLLRYLFVGEQVRDGLVARGDKRVGSEPVRL